jgi:hypothetical protein
VVIQLDVKTNLEDMKGAVSAPSTFNRERMKRAAAKLAERGPHVGTSAWK